MVDLPPLPPGYTIVDPTQLTPQTTSDVPPLPPGYAIVDPTAGMTSPPRPPTTVGERALRLLKQTGQDVEGILAGTATPVAGIGQLAGRGMQAVGVPGGAPLTNASEDALRWLNATGSPVGRKMGEYVGIPLAAMAAAATLPEWATIGGAGLLGAGLGGAMLRGGLSGALTGGLLGATTPVENPGDNYWHQKAVQTSTGLATGGALGGVLRGLAPPAVQNLTDQEVDQLLTKLGGYWTPNRITGATTLNKRQAVANNLGIPIQAPSGLLDYATNFTSSLPGWVKIGAGIEGLQHAPEALQYAWNNPAQAAALAGAYGLLKGAATPAGQRFLQDTAPLLTTTGTNAVLQNRAY
jgi:hypothetical protein